MSQLEVDKIIPSSGTTITIGDAGDTINISDGTALTVDTNTLAIDQANNRVGIGETSPSSKLHIKSSDVGAFTPFVGGDDLIIEGSEAGIGFMVGAADASNISFGDTANAKAGRINYDHSTDAMRFFTNDGERMRINSSGNVGIGTSSPAKELHVYASSGECAIQVEGNAGDAGLNLKAVSTSASFVNFGDESTINVGQIYYSHPGNTMQFKTNATERMRIDNEGIIRAGNLNEKLGGGTNFLSLSGNGYATLRVRRGSDNGDAVVFYGSSSSTSGVGTISVTTSSTAYNTSSDYRLKENVVDITGATERLKQLQPKRFNFIADADTTVDGFLAHEVSSIVPEAVTGEKDAMRTEEYEVTPAELDEEGNIITQAVMGTREVPDYQGIDQSKLVPLLVATIKELEARIEALENA
jgi:hypothetical protein